MINAWIFSLGSPWLGEKAQLQGKPGEGSCGAFDHLGLIFSLGKTVETSTRAIIVI